MFNPLRYVTKMFDTLHEVTSNETVEDSTYADTRSRDGVYAITNTQSAESTYAVGEQTSTGTVETAPEPAVETFECEDPRTCPTCEPV